MKQEITGVAVASSGPKHRRQKYDAQRENSDNKCHINATCTASYLKTGSMCAVLSSSYEDILQRGSTKPE